MFRYFTLDDFNFKDKIVGVRVDINSPQINKKIVMNERIKAATKTLKELIKKEAKIVIIGHQGRKGREDCVSLKEHVSFLEKEINMKIKFIPELYSDNVKSKIANLKKGEICVLENLRFYDDEKLLDKPGNIIKELEILFDFYVFDAFSVSHRPQTSIIGNSIIGFKKIPMIAGRQVEKELKGLNRILETPKPAVYVFGGTKAQDLIDLMKKNLPAKKVDFIILTGIIGEIALLIKGAYLGIKEKFLQEKDFLSIKNELENLMEKYPKNFILPKDVAIFDGKKRIEIAIENLYDNKKLLDEYLIKDIGSKTVEFNINFLKNVGSIYLKGPAGDFEDKNFQTGTAGIFKAIAKSSAFTYMGGGHSVTALEKFAKLSDFNYISLAGGALIHFLSGKILPGIQALEKSFKMHDSHYEDFLVLGANTIDIEVNVPCKFSDFYLGDKIRIEDDFRTTIGGGGINVSICLSCLGGKTAYLGKISEESKTKVTDILAKNRIELFKTKISKKAAAKSILLDTEDGDRIIFTYRGPNSDLLMNDFEYNKINAKNFYLAALSGESFKTYLSLAKQLKDDNPYTNICMSLSSHVIRKEKNLKTLLKYIDVVIMNLEEAEMLSGQKNVSKCLIEIKKTIKELVIITNGVYGAYAYDGKNEYYVPSVKVNKIVDTTGSGDCFSGTFFYFWSKGFGIKKSMEFAASNAANVIKYKGPHGFLYYEDLVK